jgi:hypothetical protein
MELSAAEQKVIMALNKSGMPISQATVVVIMTARSITRSRSQLVDVILTGYPGLEDDTETDSAVGALLASGWLVETSASGLTLCTAAPDIARRVAEYVDDPTIAERLLNARVLQDPSITLLGPINGEETRLAFLRALRGAQRDIRLPFLATPATLEPVSELESRARQGVRLRILLASPDVVSRIRGDSQRKRAHDSVRGWTDLTRDWPNTEVRVTKAPIDVLMSASCSFDETRAQLAVYDIWRQRSQESTLVEVYQIGSKLNLVQLFNQHFDTAWNRARPTSGRTRYLWWFSRLGWELVLFVSIACTALFLVRLPVLGNIAGGVAATALVTVMARYRDVAARILQRLRLR